MNVDDRQLMRAGTAAFLEELARTDLDADSALPGWTRRHLVAHVAANARALTRLAVWAHTGIESPMYPSPEARLQEIEDGLRIPEPELRASVEQSAADLEAALSTLRAEQWSASVRTAQGREIPAAGIVWLRCREVFIHRVDLAAEARFEDLPDAFLTHLVAEIATLRGNRPGEPALRLSDGTSTWLIGDADRAVEVTAPLADLAGWLSGRGRPHTLSPSLPDLPAWL